MPEESAVSEAAVPALSSQTQQAQQLWKAPASIADTQKPIQLETGEFGSSFIPYEIEYGVVMGQLSKIYKSWESTIREYIANAESACMSALKFDPAYRPEINIVYNPEQCTLIIEDNGIGLSKRMFLEVFRYFGRSRNAFDPTISGMFGLGAKSFVMLVGDKGSMIIHTKSRETGECYRMYARKVGFDVLPNEDRDYGTLFTFVHDPCLNKLSVIKAIGKYSRFVRVPVNFTIAGSPVTVDNPDYKGPMYQDIPKEVVLKPSGPTVISMISPEAVLDKKIVDYIKDNSSIYRKDRPREFIKLHYETEHYDFWGLIILDSDEGKSWGNRSTGSADILLISMPTEEVQIDLFTKAVIRVKSETGPEWLPRPTPDRERFEDKSKQAFIERLMKDLAGRLPALTGSSRYYSSLDHEPVARTFEGTGKVETYAGYFALNDSQRQIWSAIHESHQLRNGFGAATLGILDTVHTGVEEWRPDERGGYRSYHSHRPEVRTLQQAVDMALEGRRKIYIAPLNSTRSSSMRARAVSARMGGYNIVLLSPQLSSLPPELIQEVPVFCDLIEVPPERKEKLDGDVAFHEVNIYSGTGEARRSSQQKSLASIAKLERNQAVAFTAEDNISDYINLLTRPTHTCPVGVFKATKAQIRWLADNSQILSIREYVEWAKKQKLDTSRGKLTIEYLVSNCTTFFHSVGNTAGRRLLNAFRNREDMVYVPLTGEDYFMAAAVLQHKKQCDVPADTGESKPFTGVHKRIPVGDSSDLAGLLHINLNERGVWTDEEQERKGLGIYAHLVLEDPDDLGAIDEIARSQSIRSVARIIDCMVKLRQKTPAQKNRNDRPEALGQFFRMVDLV